MKDSIHDWFLYYFNSFKCGKAIIKVDTPNQVKNPKSYCINTKGEVLFTLEPNMFCTSFESENVLFVTESGLGFKMAVLDEKGNNLTGFYYDNIYSGAENGFFEVSLNGLHGHIDTMGRTIIPCLYNNGEYFSEGLACEEKCGKWGVIDPRNSIVVPFIYQQTGVCENNLIPAKKNKKWGIIDRYNNILCDFKFDDIILNSNRECHHHIAQIEEKYGLIDRFGNILLDIRYDEILIFNEFNGYFGVKLDKKYAIYSEEFNDFITKFEFDEIEDTFVGNPSCPTFPVQLNGKWALVDNYGNMVTDFIYDSANGFEENLCIVTKNGKYGAIDVFGDEIIPFTYDKLNYSSNGIMVARKDDEFGCINHRNEAVIKFGKFHSFANCFSDGFIYAVDKNHKRQYIDTNGDVLKLKVD